MTAVPNFRDVPGTKTPFLSQLEMNQGPVNFINIFVLESKEKEKDFLQNWERDGNHMKKQPGMLSAQLYRERRFALVKTESILVHLSPSAIIEALH